ncbi:MAG: hypothetical protein DBY25_07830 [Clostridiales bacterium]|nr:MAG: hypothetical protein DBY25_07830 [Clostridiales bacterium]
MKHFSASACCLAILLLFCSGCTSALELDLYQTMTSVYQTALDPYNEQWLMVLDSGETGEHFGISQAFYTEAVAYVPQKETSATVFAGFHAQKDKKDALKDALQTAKENAEASFEGVLPDQLAVAQNAELKEYGDYLFLIMTEHNGAVLTTLDNAINGKPLVSSEPGESADGKADSDISEPVDVKDAEETSPGLLEKDAPEIPVESPPESGTSGS